MIAKLKTNPLRETYPALMIAKGAGKCLNLTSTLLFVSMCRWVLTSIRNTPAGKFFALDVIVDIHKVLGVVYVVFALIHTAAHVFTFLHNSKAKENTVTLKDNSTRVDYNFLLTSKFCWFTSFFIGCVHVSVLSIPRIIKGNRKYVSS